MKKQQNIRLKWLEKPNLHNRKRATALLAVTSERGYLPKRQNIYCLVLPFRQQVALCRYPQATLSLACGYENQAFQAISSNH